MFAWIFFTQLSLLYLVGPLNKITCLSYSTFWNGGEKMLFYRTHLLDYGLLFLDIRACTNFLASSPHILRDAYSFLSDTLLISSSIFYIV